LGPSSEQAAQDSSRPSETGPNAFPTAHRAALMAIISISTEREFDDEDPSCGSGSDQGKFETLLVSRSYRSEYCN
jgi:hypothetical protein